MSLTPATLAFDIISRNKAKVQPAKYTPRGPQAEAVVRFMGRPADPGGHQIGRASCRERVSQRV